MILLQNKWPVYSVILVYLYAVVILFECSFKFVKYIY